MKDSTAQAISTVGIWIAVAIILTWGVFRTNWSDMGLVAMVAIVFMICAAAGLGTAAIWGGLGSLQKFVEKKNEI